MTPLRFSTSIAFAPCGRSILLSGQCRGPVVAAAATVRPFSTVDSTQPPSSSPPSSYSSSTLREKLLTSALQQVPEYGWTTAAIMAAVRQDHPNISLSYATTLTETDLVHGFMESANERLRNDLRNKVIQEDKDWVQWTRLDRMAYAMQTRLAMVQPYLVVGRWHQGMALGAQDPQVAWETSQHLKDLIHIVVQETVSDKDQQDQQLSQSLSDLSQVSLGAVYVATECHMLADTSVDYQDTWTFLRQQLHHWHSLNINGPLSTTSVSDAAFLASTVATAFGHGLLSVSNIRASSSSTIMPDIPPPPPLDQMAQSVWNTVLATTATATTTTTPAATTTVSASRSTAPTEESSTTSV